MNPEIRRYAWVDLSQTRLVLAPAVIGILVLSIYSGQGPAAVLGWLNALAGICCLWGMGQCSNSVGEEVVANTWDWQRLSPQDAFTLAVGKIIGAPIFQWFLFAICVGTYALMGILSGTHSATHILEWIYRWTMTLLLGFSIAVIGSVESARSLRTVRRPGGRFRSNVVVFFLFAGFAPGMATHLASRGADRIMENGGQVYWYGYGIPLWTFLDLSLLIYVLWALAGCYRSMKSELQFRCAPWLWLAFLLFLTLYVTPLFQVSPSSFLFSIVLFVIASAATYMNVIREDKDIVTFRRLLERSSGSFPAHLIPCWLVSFALTLVGLAGLFLSAAPDYIPIAKNNVAIEMIVSNIRNLAVIATLMLIRDSCLLLAIHVRNPRNRRNDVAFLFYLACLYGIVPMCLRLIVGPSATLIFWPLQHDHFVISSYYWALPLAIASVIFLWTSLQRAFRPLPSTPQA